MNKNQKATVSIVFGTIKEWFAGRITREECERRIGVYATAAEVGRVMDVADTNKATAQRASWKPLQLADVAKAYLS